MKMRWSRLWRSATGGEMVSWRAAGDVELAVGPGEVDVEARVEELASRIEGVEARVEGLEERVGKRMRIGWIPYPVRAVLFTVLGFTSNMFGAGHYLRGDGELAVLCAASCNVFGAGCAIDFCFSWLAAMDPPPRAWRVLREVYFVLACWLAPRFIREELNPDFDEPAFAYLVLFLTGRMPLYCTLLIRAMARLNANLVGCLFLAWHGLNTSPLTWWWFLLNVVQLAFSGAMAHHAMGDLGPGMTLYLCSFAFRRRAVTDKFAERFCGGAAFTFASIFITHFANFNHDRGN